jgi:uncharacterized GH25 family protein
MGQLTRATLLAVVAALLSAVVAAQYGPTPVGKLEGIVLDAKGHPVADASVTMQTSDGLHPHATHTDASGRFEFDRWATGQYDLRAYSNGNFSDWDKRILIRAGKTTTITLRLRDEK